MSDIVHGDWENNKKVIICKEENKVIKLYKNAPYDDIAESARIQQFLFDSGLPVPAVYGVRKISETETALEMAYIESKPFTYDGIGKDEQINALTVMAKLQSMIYAVDASGFPRLADYFAKEIKSTPYLTAQIKEKAVDLLYSLDAGKTNLCHGDFHPGNIIYDGEKHWVIDWEEPSRGDPAADACMTYFYERRFGGEESAEIYLRLICGEAEIKREDVLAWLPVIAAYQVNINDDEQRKFILDVISECFSSR